MADTTIPRSEHPRPQFVREHWMNLNGRWGFEIDVADTGIQRGLLDRELDREIIVPFAPETPLSGVEYGDYINAAWYRREVDIPTEWTGRKVLLHFQAVNTDATVWVNGQEVYRHRGGWSPFAADLSGVVSPGERATIVVRARHNRRKPGAYGKGCMGYTPETFDGSCMAMTGIWQTVWLESVAEVHFHRPRITPDVSGKRFRLELPLSQNRADHRVRATLAWEGQTLATEEVPADGDFVPMLDLSIPADQVYLWGPGEGNLYDITLELLDADGEVIDLATTYAGLRSVTLDGRDFKINGQRVFQRLVLDQGQYLDGAYTAPSDAALLQDIELSMEAGFNGARLHEKVFEERTLYHADRMGYLVWGEFGDWGYDSSRPPMDMVTQWLEVIGRDYNHPSIIGWCGLNEAAKEIEDEIDPLHDLLHAMFLAAKTADPTRPVLDASGYSHRVRETDIWDAHEYDFDSDPKKWASLFQGDPYTNIPVWMSRPVSAPYAGQPYFVSEFGGTRWDPRSGDEEPSWGYGNRPETVEEFYDLFAIFCDTLLDNPGIFGYCYTQLTDTFPEQNGVVYQDRTYKCDLSRLREIQSRPAAYEQK
jgi:beta-galactosidase/beta-glucuronidase